jgi:RNA polymerase sigma-70 factor (ECF subfamily)
MTPERFYETIEPFKEKLYGFAFRMLGNREDTKDALQDVLLKLWKMRFEIDIGRVESLAMTIMKNVCVDRLREKKKLNGHISESPEINGYTLTNFGDKDLVKRVGEEIKNLSRKVKEKKR